MGNEAIGLVFAVLSCLFNGLFPALNKIKSVAACNVNPFIFNLYFSIGVFTSSVVVFLVLLGIGEDLVFTPWGILSGFLLVGAGFWTFVAVPKVGLSVGQGIWSGTAMIVSFVAGVIFDKKNRPKDLNASIASLLFLVAGVAVVAFCKDIPVWMGLMAPEEDEEETMGYKRLGTSTTMSNSKYVPDDNKRKQGDGENKMDIFGVFSAVMVGCFGGLIGIGLVFAPEDAKEIKFVPSFAVGVSFAFPLTFLILTLQGPLPMFHAKACFIPGFFAGVVWNMANVCSFYAIARVGYSVAYPIMQSSLVVGAVMGVCVFKELTGTWPILTLIVGSLLVICGAILLSYFH